MTRRHTLIPVLALFLIVAPYCFFGFDITDTGFNLYEQHRTFHSGLSYFVQDLQMPLSNWIGGLLQVVSFTGSLIESKLQGLLIYCLAAFLILKIVDQVMGLNFKESSKSAILIFFFSLIALNPHKSGAILIPSYDNIPIILYLLITYMLVRFWIKADIKSLYGAYFIFLLLVLTKISLLPVLALFGFVLVISYFKNRAFLVQQTLALIIVSAISILYAKYFQSGNAVDLEQGYTLQNLLVDYLKDLSKFPTMLFLLTALLGIIYIFERHPKFKRITWIFLSVVALMMLKKYYHFHESSSSYKLVYKFKYMFGYSVSIYFMLATIILLLGYKKMNAQQIFLCLAAMLFPCFLDFGTNNGLQKMGHGIALMPPILYVMFNRKNEVLGETLFKGCALLGFVALINLYTSFYRDSPDPRALQASFHFNKLSAIHTTAARKQVYEELLVESQKYMQKDDVILAFDYNPMFYWVTQTTAIQNLSWPHIFTVNQIKEKASNLCKSAPETPKVIVKTLVSPFDKTWPEENSPYKGSDREKVEVIDAAFMANCKPEKKWANAAFEIWTPTVTW